jgi:hypothetical protein
MKRQNTTTLSIALAGALLASLGAAQAQDVQPLAGGAAMAAVDTAFTYQGQLRKSGAPVNGTCNFQFRLFNAATDGTQIGLTQTKSGVSVTNGLFTIPDLDFGPGAFNGEARWLAIAVQCPGDSGYTSLSPRQALRAAPYAHSLRPGAQVIGQVAGGSVLSVDNTAANGTGVYGLHSATTGTAPGVHGRTNSMASYAVGVLGEVASTNPGGYSAAVRGINNGTGANGIGVWGSQAGSGWGVYGKAGANGTGVLGTAGANGIGVYGYAPSSGTGAGHAGYFDGHVHVDGNLSASGLKPFKIDHPLDPANRYLYHFAQEAPEVQNVYNGVVTLDADGGAVVTLPEYFSAINRGPFRYQLTAIGAPMPNLHVAQEIQGNVFRIAGGAPGQKVSWEVTAIRNDPYLRDHPAVAEVDKPAHEKGTYLYPKGYGQPETMGLDYQHVARLREVQSGGD